MSRGSFPKAPLGLVSLVADLGGEQDLLQKNGPVSIWNGAPSPPPVPLTHVSDFLESLFWEVPWGGGITCFFFSAGHKGRSSFLHRSGDREFLLSFAARKRKILFFHTRRWGKKSQGYQSSACSQEPPGAADPCDPNSLLDRHEVGVQNKEPPWSLSAPLEPACLTLWT